MPSLPQITKQQLQQTKDRFQAFLNGDTQIVADEAFINAVQSYNEVPTHHSCGSTITARSILLFKRRCFSNGSLNVLSYLYIHHPYRKCKNAAEYSHWKMNAPYSLERLSCRLKTRNDQLSVKKKRGKKSSAQSSCYSLSKCLYSDG